jgi:hypothetical protein
MNSTQFAKNESGFIRQPVDIYALSRDRLGENRIFAAGLIPLKTSRQSTTITTHFTSF